MRRPFRLYRRRIRRYRVVRRLPYVLGPALALGLLIIAGVFFHKALTMHRLVPGYEKAKTTGTATVCNQPAVSDRPCISFLTGRVVAEDADTNPGGRYWPSSWGLTVEFTARDRSTASRRFELYKKHADLFPIGGAARVYYIGEAPFGIIAPNEPQWHPLLTNPRQQRRDALVFAAPSTLFGLGLLITRTLRLARVLPRVRARRRLSMRVA